MFVSDLLFKLLIRAASPAPYLVAKRSLAHFPIQIRSEAQVTRRNSVLGNIFRVFLELCRLLSKVYLRLAPIEPHSIRFQVQLHEPRSQNKQKQAILLQVKAEPKV